MRVNTDDPIFRFRAALRAFAQARQRFETCEATAPIDVFAPLAEALWWARVVEEGFEELCKTGYEGLAAEPGAQLMRGIRFARNRSHQRAVLVWRSEGFSWPVTWPLRWYEFVWRPIVELPAGQRDPTGYSCYEQYLAEKPARHTLIECAAWFDRCLEEFKDQLSGDQ